MKKISFLFMALILVTSLIIAGCAAPEPKPKPAPEPAPEPIVWEAVSLFPAGYEIGIPVQALADKVNTRSNGELRIDFLGGPEVIGMFDQASAVKAGVVEMAFIFTGAYSGLVPGSEAVAFSRLTPDEEHETGFWDFMVGLHKEAGLFYLGSWNFSGSAPVLFIYTNVRVDRPQELAGQKMAGVGMIADPFMKALGMAHTLMSYGDLYSAMEQGVVDGFWDSRTGPVGMGLTDVSKYFIDHGFYVDNTVFIVNLDSWNSLPQHLQDLVMESAEEVGREMPAMHKEVVDRDTQAMLDAGVELIKFSPADAKWFTELAYEIAWDDLTQKYPEIAAEAKALLTK